MGARSRGGDCFRGMLAMRTRFPRTPLPFTPSWTLFSTSPGRVGMSCPTACSLALTSSHLFTSFFPSDPTSFGMSSARSASKLLPLTASESRAAHSLLGGPSRVFGKVNVVTSPL